MKPTKFGYLFRKLRLSFQYGIGIYLLSAPITLAIPGLMCINPSIAHILIPIGIIAKLFCIPIILYLFITFQNRNTLYFYLNLGFSRTEYYSIPIVIDFLCFILLIILSNIVIHVI